MPFTNYSLTKNGQLTIGQIFSPDYVPGVSGWTINKSGTVEFNNGTFRGTISGGTLIISQGSGATFEQFEINGATGVTTWSKYQSPTVVIRQILANGTDLIYADPGNGEPQGALTSSVSQAAGTDLFSDPYFAGIVSYASGLVAAMNIGELLLTYQAGVNYVGQPALAQPGGVKIEAPATASNNPALLIEGPSADASALTSLPFMLLSGRSADGTSGPSMTIANADASQLVITLSNGYITTDAWHNIPLDTGWTAVSGQTPKYRLLPTGDIEFSGAAMHASFTIAQNLNGSNPLAAAYRPVSNHYVRTSNGSTVADTYFVTSGVIQGLGQASGSTQIRLDGICPLN